MLSLLCVDDDKGILNSLKRTLKGEDYEVIVANSGQEALEILKERSVQVVLSDVMMPEMDGVELVNRIKQQYPEIIRLILTGTDDKNVTVKLINTGEIYRYIAKPWDTEELKYILRQSFEHFRLNNENKRLLQENKRISEELVEMNLTLQSDSTDKNNLLGIYTKILDMVEIPIIFINAFQRKAKANISARDLLNIRAEEDMEILVSKLSCEAKESIEQYISVDYNPKISMVYVAGEEFSIQSLGTPDNYEGCLMIGGKRY